MKTLRYGIEIETVGLNRERLARAIQTVIGGEVVNDGRSWRAIDPTGRAWQVVPDGSLSGGEQSGEIVSPILTYSDLDTLQNIIRAVRGAGARADFSTGIHIHIDGARFDAKSTTNLVKNVHKQERLLEHALGVSEARLSRYCRPIDPAFIERLEARRPRTMRELSEAWYGHNNPNPQRYDGSRYHGLNLNSLFFRGTIEFRYFNGTLHAGEVKAYLQLVLAMAAKALTSKAASSNAANSTSPRPSTTSESSCLGSASSVTSSRRRAFTSPSGSRAARHGRASGATDQPLQPTTTRRRRPARRHEGDQCQGYRVTLGRSQQGLPEPRIEVQFAPRTNYRKLHAALHLLAASVELATPAAEKWIAQMVAASGSAAGWVYLELLNGTEDEAQRGLAMKWTPIFRPVAKRGKRCAATEVRSGQNEGNTKEA